MNYARHFAFVALSMLVALAAAAHETETAQTSPAAADSSDIGQVKITKSGLEYQVLVQGDGPKPIRADTVVVHYKGMLTNGTVFDSSYDRGAPARFPLTRVIKGWTEGLQLMPVGSKYRMTIPHYLAYGDEPPGDAIPPNATLIFEIELLAIE